MCVRRFGERVITDNFTFRRVGALSGRWFFIVFDNVLAALDREGSTLTMLLRTFK